MQKGYREGYEGSIMKFNDRKRSCLVGAQWIGASPMYRPGKPINEPLADKSAVCAINRHLLDNTDVGR